VNPTRHFSFFIACLKLNLVLLLGREGVAALVGAQQRTYAISFFSVALPFCFKENSLSESQKVPGPGRLVNYLSNPRSYRKTLFLINKKARKRRLSCFNVVD